MKSQPNQFSKQAYLDWQYAHELLTYLNEQVFAEIILMKPVIESEIIKQYQLMVDQILQTIDQYEQWAPVRERLLDVGYEDKHWHSALKAINIHVDELMLLKETMIGDKRNNFETIGRAMNPLRFIARMYEYWQIALKEHQLLVILTGKENPLEVNDLEHALQSAENDERLKTYVKASNPQTPKVQTKMIINGDQGLNKFDVIDLALRCLTQIMNENYPLDDQVQQGLNFLLVTRELPEDQLPNVKQFLILAQQYYSQGFMRKCTQVSSEEQILSAEIGNEILLFMTNYWHANRTYNRFYSDHSEQMKKSNELILFKQLMHLKGISEKRIDDVRQDLDRLKQASTSPGTDEWVELRDWQELIAVIERMVSEFSEGMNSVKWEEFSQNPKDYEIKVSNSASIG